LVEAPGINKIKSYLSSGLNFAGSAVIVAAPQFGHFACIVYALHFLHFSILLIG